MVGKWRLGHGPGDLPDGHGFDRSLALDASGADNWAPRPYMPYYAEAPWFKDGAPAKLPASFYSSEYFVDRLIADIDKGDPAEPYFAYLSLQAVHIPVQAPRAYSDRYKGRFDQGWEMLRVARWRRAQASGLIPEGAGYTPLPASLRRWASLSVEEKRMAARSMEVYAGMLEAMDHHIGRLVARVEARGELDQTVFVVTSDNGPEPSDPVHPVGMNLWMALNGYSWDVDTLGERGSLGFIGPEWAAAIASPSSLYKFYASEGGLRVPLVIAGPGVRAGGRVSSIAFVTDVAPTLLALAGVASAAPAGSVPMVGRSLAPVLAGQSAEVRGPEDEVGFEVSGNAALFRGTLKIVRNMPPVGDGRWRLYDLAIDPGETSDLAKARPETFAAMQATYAAYAEVSGVLPLPEGYAVEQQVRTNTMAKQRERYGWLAALLGLTLLALLIMGVLRIAGRWRVRAA